MQQLIALIERHKAGEPVGVFSVCSAHPWVIRAAMAQAVRRGEPVLIEATSNQVNQFGGYTGMTPAQFRDAVWRQADECGLPRQRVWLGGDHLGPNAWQDRPASAAMALAETLIDDYVAAGFRKIHLDCSMRCQDDPAQLDDEQVSQRAARLCAVAERRWQRDGGEPPVYIIGTEVPVPGGAHEALDGLAVTSPQAVAQTLNTHHQAWRAAGLEAVWPRVIGLVVQPGVEFDHQSVERYRPKRAAALSRFIEQWPHLVYEAHSTDYQSPQAYRQLVRDHFAILKVGPALTYALREALFALDRIEREWRGEHRAAHLCATLEQVMGDHPGYWQRYYPGTPQQQRLHRRYSLSDRVRYYWPRPEVAQAVEALLDNLRAHPAPMTLLSQYLPAQARALAAGQLSADPLDWIMHKIGEVLTGAGSSAFAGRALAPWLRQQTGRDVKAYGTTDIVANPYHYLDPSRPLLLVSFARSGNSPESVAAVALADQCVPACHHLLLVCNPDSQLCDWAAGKAHVCTQVMPEGTHDKSFAMTSSFSSMLLAGLLLLGPQDIAQTAAPLAQMADECEQLLVRRQPQVKALAAGGYRRYIVVGGSCFTGLAEEAALKMLELTAGNVATRFDSSLGLRHGPKFMVDGHTLLLVLFSADPYARQYDRDLWQELRRDGLAGVLCAFGGAGEAVEGVDVIYREDNDAWLMFPYLLLTQMLAFETSLALGITPDNPSPGGSVNRVVQGVSIYPYAGAPAAASDRSDKRGSACI